MFPLEKHKLRKNSIPANPKLKFMPCQKCHIGEQTKERPWPCVVLYFSKLGREKDCLFLSTLWSYITRQPHTLQIYAITMALNTSYLARDETIVGVKQSQSPISDVFAPKNWRGSLDDSLQCQSTTRESLSCASAKILWNVCLNMGYHHIYLLKSWYLCHHTNWMIQLPKQVFNSC